MLRRPPALLMLLLLPVADAFITARVPPQPLVAARGGLVRLAAAPLDEESPAGDKPPSVAFLMAVAGLQSACFGCIGTALPPALRASGLDPSSVALLLGRLGSASALCEVLLSNSFGKLSDAIGRKPIMLAAPAITVVARFMVVLSPRLPVLIGARLITTLVVPVYWLAYQVGCEWLGSSSEYTEAMARVECWAP